MLCIEKYKARLVEKWFTQKPGIEYEETYSPVAKFTSTIILMSMVATLDLDLYQMDVKTAFLNEEIKEEICMQQPDCYKVKGQENKVYKLKKSMYDMKLASRKWHYTFHNLIVSFGIRSNDYC